MLSPDSTCGVTVNFSVKDTSTGTGDFLGIPPIDETVDGLASQIFIAGVTPGDIDILVSAGGADSGTAGDRLITLNDEI